MTNLRIIFFTSIISTCLIFSASAASLSDKDTAQLLALKTTALSSNLAYEIDESLTTEVGARMVGTAGDKRAVTWAMAKMKQLGFDKVWTEDVIHHSWIRGTAEARIIAPYPQKMVANCFIYPSCPIMEFPVIQLCICKCFI